jgi:predicted RNA-binding Zn ribbon-like protein
VKRSSTTRVPKEPVIPEVPHPIAVVRDFVNTTDHELGTDDLTSPAELAEYLAQRSLAPRGVEASAADLDIALRLRAGLRRALELNHDGTQEALPELAEVMVGLPVTITWTPEGTVLTTTDQTARGGLARIAIAAHEAVAAGVWWRLKICAWDECEWAFYDHSKNRSRNWCEYGCGNKVKTRAYRARRAAARTP